MSTSASTSDFRPVLRYANLFVHLPRGSQVRASRKAARTLLAELKPGDAATVNGTTYRVAHANASFFEPGANHFSNWRTKVLLANGHILAARTRSEMRTIAEIDTDPASAHIGSGSKKFQFASDAECLAFARDSAALTDHFLPAISERRAAAREEALRNQGSRITSGELA